MKQAVLHAVISVAVSVGVSALLRLGQWAIELSTPKHPGEFRLPSYVGATGLLSGAFAGGVLAMGLLGDMNPARHDYGAWVTLLLGFAAGGVYLTICAGNWRMWLSEAGLQIRNELGATRALAPWSSIARVRPKWTSVMVFDLRDGGALKVPFHTAGLLEAVRAAHAHGAAMEESLVAEIHVANSHGAGGSGPEG